MESSRKLVEHEAMMALDRLEEAGINVSLTPTGAIASRSNGAPIKVYVELVSSLLRVRRENPHVVAELISRRTEERAG